MKVVIRLIPLVLFLLLGLLLFRGLSLNPQDMPSALVGKSFPQFQLTKLKDAGQTMTSENFNPGIKIVNVWATWCPSCKIEHPFLVKLSKDPRFSVYGINYKDERGAAVEWLQYYKDPYQFSVYDVDGKLGLDLGVYGAPETFVVDHNNIIRKRFAGVLEKNVWQREFLPLINQIEMEMGGS
ncbi:MULTISPECIES: DsbE family thiol:disulfide interchange protein [unclassified Thalassotalea]|uniref:DsbE family thiol:disulfide interchange protein n=1 Tax=unclassified Thalassotalea TaxID=2614972 RepID=UPI00108045EE|nr:MULTISPECIES: DsbE family thiol:disulfide interchange protein [unclassified Thalassotalea]NMP15848.1 DsbE family thiol:disulfide interchange protein [Thalassotalea sp. Y01]QBY04891.1 DsbE family thiol:disulfide interchange protein [Thalassotalea sp. HSM 43]